MEIYQLFLKLAAFSRDILGNQLLDLLARSWCLVRPAGRWFYQLDERRYPFPYNDAGSGCAHEIRGARVSPQAADQLSLTAPIIHARAPCHLVVQPVRFSNHERSYYIVDQVSGQPLFDPTVYALSQLRPRNLAATTIRNASYAILALHLACAAEGIDLSSRVAAAQPLSLPNLQLIRRRMRMTLIDLRQAADGLMPEKSNSRPSKRNKTTKAWISSAVFKARMYEAYAYIRWLYEMEMGRRHQLSPEYAILDASVQQLERVQRLFKAVASRTRLGKREALNESVVATLLSAIEVGSPSNPWVEPFVQTRNLLTILLGLRLGLRIGEILGLKCSDLKLREGAIIIRRRADDPEDPRSEQPNAKTCDRVLRFGEEVAAALENFIIHHRAAVTGAHEHDFLIVAHRTGRPLSPSAAKKSFQVLRSKVPGLPSDLVAHILRHCFNDDFSKAADKKRLPEAKEVKIRSYANGWSEHSGSAAFYTRRHVRREANKLSLEVQAATVAATQPVS